MNAGGRKGIPAPPPHIFDWGGGASAPPPGSYAYGREGTPHWGIVPQFYFILSSNSRLRKIAISCPPPHHATISL